MTGRCDCYPGGFTPGTYEGPQRHCPVHGDGSGISAEDMWHQSCLQARAAFDVLMRQHRALRAERDGLVESIAAGFDSRAAAALEHQRGLDQDDRDIDVVLAWECAARWIREHAANRPSASVEPQTSPGGTPGNPCPSRIAHESGGGIRCRQTGPHIVHTNMVEGPNRVAWVSGDDREYLPATSPTGGPTR